MVDILTPITKTIELSQKLLNLSAVSQNADAQRLTELTGHFTVFGKYKCNSCTTKYGPAK
jgi:hypothetical protein